MHVPIQITSRGKSVETRALIDCGAGGKFIDQEFVRQHHLPTRRLFKPIRALNVDGTPNKNGIIRTYTLLPVKVHGRTCTHRLYICGLGQQTIILGMPWLRETNPIIDWKRGTLE
ncbi:retroviral-like aspartic protease, partial [Roseomonas nepalensis]